MISSRTVTIGLLILAVVYIAGLLLKNYVLKEGMANISKEVSSEKIMAESFNFLSQNQNLSLVYNDESLDMKYNAEEKTACMFKNGKLQGCLQYDPLRLRICELDRDKKLKSCLKFFPMEQKVCKVNADGRKEGCIKYIPGDMPKEVETNTTEANANLNATSDEGVTFNEYHIENIDGNMAFNMTIENNNKVIKIKISNNLLKFTDPSGEIFNVHNVDGASYYKEKLENGRIKNHKDIIVLDNIVDGINTFKVEEVEGTFLFSLNDKKHAMIYLKNGKIGMASI